MICIGDTSRQAETGRRRSNVAHARAGVLRRPGDDVDAAGRRAARRKLPPDVRDPDPPPPPVAWRQVALRTPGRAQPNGDGHRRAALWDPPGRWQATRGEELRMMPGLFAGVRHGRCARPGRRGADEEGSSGGAALVSRGHRQRPDVRGQGFGQALMRSRLDRCRRRARAGLSRVEQPRQRWPVLPAVRLRE